MDSALAQQNPHRNRKKFVLCFDGTGNKFSGTDADSNILKIYRMLDRSDDEQFHYYQPGIGTYVVSKSLTHTSRIDRLKSWYAKAKDSAVGTSFAAHVMGGYKFLMRYYLPGDDIYLFGFSRGAYTARFLAEMLDHVGLLSVGALILAKSPSTNFIRLAMKKCRNAEEKKQKKELLEFMCAFRETFSRPVRAIRFLGLFDTVNSVPAFENAWMQRSKFPYTARSSAVVIRHAVSIDERRAKFRQDLVSQEKPDKSKYYNRRHKHRHISDQTSGKELEKEQDTRGRKLGNPGGRRETLAVPERYRSRSETAGIRALSPSLSVSERAGPASETSSEEEQDIQEVWFAGCHADIGGGWPLAPGEDAALSHVPLVWMVREAQRAGLNFDDDKLRVLNCTHEDPATTRDPTPLPETRHPTITMIPTIEIDPASPAPIPQAPPFGETLKGITEETNGSEKANDEKLTNGEGTEVTQQKNQHQHHHHHHESRFHNHLHFASTQGRIHDVLQLKNGVAWTSVMSWNIMEYLPFRRMDLQENGQWKSITWPLPKGETRDIPETAVIHTSVIRRMENDPTYRPGNLIVGGGGRGVRTAPREMGTGKWLIHREEGDPVGECYIRAEKPERMNTAEQEKPLAMAPNGPQGIFLGKRN
ncbi:hypothetical protein EJ04DRAFT_600775 [Polyplosphaeria fusca]|uniref:T6SS Phospholipase effector Tle1-like catalytic domain-containing protein n=1 Tax=Polyplosphaeria fusca TaxID=682080 RepID=A0A9P4V740_9PLEO|nr:hypothetical protein EJ04DRAFT_600775 [Polyplosphaeria fusca]